MTTTTSPETTAHAATTTPPIVPAAAAPTRTLGILSLVLGIVSVVSGFQFVIGAAAIVLGILALRQEPASGKFAVWGIVTGAVSAMGLVWGFLGFSLLLPFAGLAAFSGYFG